MPVIPLVSVPAARTPILGGDPNVAPDGAGPGIFAALVTDPSNNASDAPTLLEEDIAVDPDIDLQPDTLVLGPEGVQGQSHFPSPQIHFAVGHQTLNVEAAPGPVADPVEWLGQSEAAGPAGRSADSGATNLVEPDPHSLGTKDTGIKAPALDTGVSPTDGVIRLQKGGNGQRLPESPAAADTSIAQDNATRRPANRQAPPTSIADAPMIRPGPLDALPSLGADGGGKVRYLDDTQAIGSAIGLDTRAHSTVGPGVPTENPLRAKVARQLTFGPRVLGDASGLAVGKPADSPIPSAPNTTETRPVALPENAQAQGNATPTLAYGVQASNNDDPSPARVPFDVSPPNDSDSEPRFGNAEAYIASVPREERPKPVTAEVAGDSMALVDDRGIFDFDLKQSGLGGPETGLRLTHAAGVHASGAATGAGLAHHIAGQIAAHIEQAASGMTEITLSPEELGKVRLILHPQGDGLSLHVIADRPETADLMRRNIETLAQDFKQLGYKSLSFEFSDGGQSAGFGTGTGNPEQHRGNPTANDSQGKVSADIPITGPTLPPGLTGNGVSGLDLRL